MDQEQLKQAAFDYHEFPRPGKYEVVTIKKMDNAHDLTLAYSPGVAEPCLEIQRDPEAAYRFTNKANFVACISNGTAVLGLGNIGALASKPVMEGKSVLFKKFAGVECVDLCIDEPNKEKLVECIAVLHPSFGGINLEDIKGPDCFYVEEELKKRMPIPVFHDDQHGTAIICLAGLINACKIKGKDMKDLKIICNGAGAAGVACTKLMLKYGCNPDKMFVCDTKGVIYPGRKEGMNPFKESLANKTITENTTLAQIAHGADVLIGVSSRDIFTEEICKALNKDPIIFAMANPNPEVTPANAHSWRDDCIIATGRSDYPNQINNVMCFPFLFRATLDTRSKQINEEMKMAAALALAELAREEVPQSVNDAVNRTLVFGPEYVIPTAFDPRIIGRVCPAVAKASMDTGNAKIMIEDLQKYKEDLTAKFASN